METGLGRGPIIWKHPETWMPVVRSWLRPRLAKGAVGRIRKADFSDLYADDSAWLEMLLAVARPDADDLVGGFADELDRMVVRAYHGCRTEDAGEYFRRGIRVHRREELEELVRSIVADDDRLRWMLPTLVARMADFPSRCDDHRCFVVLDDRALMEQAAHYLIYGSEWVCAVLGHGWRDPLLERGAPTMIEVDLPVKWVSVGLREELSKLLLGEWTRQTVAKPSGTFLEDFTFTLHHDLPPETVVGHWHPERLVDPLERMRVHRPASTTCRHCADDTRE